MLSEPESNAERLLARLKLAALRHEITEATPAAARELLNAVVARLTGIVESVDDDPVGNQVAAILDELRPLLA